MSLAKVLRLASIKLSFLITLPHARMHMTLHVRFSVKSLDTSTNSLARLTAHTTVVHVLAPVDADMDSVRALFALPGEGIHPARRVPRLFGVEVLQAACLEVQQLRVRVLVDPLPESHYLI